MGRSTTVGANLGAKADYFTHSILHTETNPYDRSYIPVLPSVTSRAPMNDLRPQPSQSSKHGLEDVAKHLRNCAAGYHDRIDARQCVFVALENETGKPVALGKADLRAGGAAPQWSEIKETSNRRASAESRSKFDAFSPSIARWWKTEEDGDDVI